MTKPIARNPIYRRRRFDGETIELCVRWYISYRLSYRDLVAMMAERGLIVSHSEYESLRPRGCDQESIRRGLWSAAVLSTWVRTTS